jgi:alpha-L-rhamnosidase
LHLEFADGTSRDVGTDGSWRTHYGPLTFSCIYGGEDFDARLEPQGWDSPGFDATGWRAAAGVEAPGGVLIAQSSPPLRVQQTFPSVSRNEVKPGIAVYDLGQNFAGWPRIEVSGAAGDQVKLTPGELLDANGLVTQRSSGGPQYFTYTLKGVGVEVWSPRFSYYGFRYVQVETTGAPVIRSLTGQFVHLDAPRIGSFRCSNDLLNRIHALIDAAIRSNLQHVLTDCPHREKLGWLEESHLMGPSLLYNWDLRTFLPKIIRDTREAQTIDGLIPDIAPEYVTFGSGFRDSPEWGSAAVALPWLAWTWYGDRQPLADSYLTMSRYMDYLQSRSAGHLLLYGLGDWYDIGPHRPGVSQLTPQGFTATAYWLTDLRILEQIARLMGRDREAAKSAEQAASVQAAFDQAHFATTSQTAIAMSSVLGLSPSADAIRRTRGRYPPAQQPYQRGGHRLSLRGPGPSGRGPERCAFRYGYPRPTFPAMAHNWLPAPPVSPKPGTPAAIAHKPPHARPHRRMVLRRSGRYPPRRCQPRLAPHSHPTGTCGRPYQRGCQMGHLPRSGGGSLALDGGRVSLNRGDPAGRGRRSFATRQERPHRE